MSSTRFDEDIWLLKRVSLGASFELYLAFWPEENDKVLIKKVRDDLSQDKKEEACQRLLKEAATLEEFWSPYFPKIYDIRYKQSQQSDSQELYLIIQYFSGVSLREYINLQIENKTISHQFIQNFIFEMDHLLNYLHNKKGIVHLDISPDNIIITQNNKVRLIDFEDSRKSGEQLDSSKLRGKEKYLSPQLIKDLREDKITTFESKWDLYAYAKVIEELIQCTKSLEKIKTFSFRKKIRALKKATQLSQSKLLLPSFFKFNLNFNFKYISSFLAIFFVLSLCLLGLDYLGRSQKKHNLKALESRPSIKQNDLPSSQAPKKNLTVKKKYRTKKRTTSLKRAPNPHKKTSTPKAQTTPQKNNFEKEFNQLISSRSPSLKECMDYESDTQKDQISLTFHLQSVRGRAQRISFEKNIKLNQLTKSCLVAIYADIIFPQHPSQKEVIIVQRFTFANDSSRNKVESPKL